MKKIKEKIERVMQKKKKVTSFTVHMNIERGELAPQLF
jgi:hypothetical protein